LVKGNAFNLFYNKIWSTKLRVLHFLIGIFNEIEVPLIVEFLNIDCAVLFLCPIRLSKLKFPPFFVWICMGICNHMSNFEILSPEPQHSYQQCRQIRSKLGSRNLWNLLNKTLISPFWVEICMGGTTPLSFGYKIAE
jgi:hypothetical protein